VWEFFRCRFGCNYNPKSFRSDSKEIVAFSVDNSFKNDMKSAFFFVSSRSCFFSPYCHKHDLEGYFESLAEQGFQNNFPFWHEAIGVSAPEGGANLPNRVIKALVIEGMNWNSGTNAPGSNSYPD